jgi:hypothetical protein
MRPECSSTNRKRKRGITVSNITEKPNRVGRLAVAMSCVALLGIGLASVTLADTWDKKTIVTFNTPVEVPGKVLPAGTFVLKLLDSASKPPHRSDF